MRWTIYGSALSLTGWINLIFSRDSPRNLAMGVAAVIAGALYTGIGEIMEKNRS